MQGVGRECEVVELDNSGCDLQVDIFRGGVLGERLPELSVEVPCEYARNHRGGEEGGGEQQGLDS